MYKIIYKDDTIFQGGNPRDSLWEKVENKGIKELRYLIGTNKWLILSGYERYNHLVEYEAIIGKGSRIVGIILMGEDGTQIERIHIDLKENKIRRSFAKLGQEYKGGLTTGWKEGIRNNVEIANWKII